MSEPTKAVAVVPETVEVREVSRTVAEPMDFPGLLRLCEELVSTKFLPRAVDTAGKAAALILTGREMGLGPMASIRSLAIVDGKPVLAADLQLGIFKRAGGQAVWERLDDTGAVLKLRHPNGDEHTESFTMADAQRAGLAGKQNWRAYPKAMLRSRAITAGLKSIGFEPLAGTYDPEELEPLPVTARTEPASAPQKAGPQAPKAEAAPKVEQAPTGQPEAQAPVGTRLPGTPKHFGGHGGKLITDPSIPEADLSKARNWLADKDYEKNAALVEAIDNEMEMRAEMAERAAGK
ncbi:MAG: hypothetical protein PHS14_16565 [Elusimicrobia bacterium]|nr:hypothetical protein [Elusimicrobiota bacterium]